MPQIDRCTFKLGNSSVDYLKVKCSRFYCEPLQREPHAAAADFHSFINWEPGANFDIVAIKDISFDDTLRSIISRRLFFSADGREEFLSIRSLVHYWAPVALQMQTLPSHDSNLQTDARKLFSDLEQCGVLAHRPAPKRQGRALAVLGNLGSIREAGIEKDEGLMSSGGYFVIGPPECASHHQVIGDPVGLLVRQGVVLNSATYPRATLIRTPDGHEIRKISIADMRITLPCGMTIDGNTALHKPQGEGPVVRVSAKRTHRPTSEEDGRRDLIVVGLNVVGIRDGGGTAIPHAGFLISGHKDVFSQDSLRKLRQGDKLDLSVKLTSDLEEGLQCGPLLVENGMIVEEEIALEEEEMISDPPERIVVPWPFRRSVGGVCAARCGVGITSSNDLILVAISGTATSHAAHTGLPNTGASLSVLARALQKEGAVSAMALDSGGSVQLFKGAGCLISSGDSRGVPGARFDRALSNIIIYQ